MAYTTIKKSSDYFNTVLYTGNQSTNAITGVGFQPDLVWLKRRDTEHHNLYDAVRGVTIAIRTSMQLSEGADVNGLTSFDSDGFTLGNGTNQNTSGVSHASWNWKANGAGSSNTDGSITSTVSANTTSGFSIVTWNNSSNSGTIGHGLGAKPSVIITKKRDGTAGWVSWFQGLGTSNEQRNYIYLDSTNASGVSGIDYWGTSINSNTFGVPSGGYDNNNGSMLAYCFAEKKGFSKFGSYTGNGNADGTFVYTGFKPAMVIFKNATTGSTNWHIVDNKRDTFNIVDKLLLPNSDGAEITQSALDFTSNGFKIRVSNGFVNTSGDNYIYMAFAEEPLVGDNPATAR